MGGSGRAVCATASSRCGCGDASGDVLAVGRVTCGNRERLEQVIFRRKALPWPTLKIICGGSEAGSCPCSVEVRGPRVEVPASRPNRTGAMLPSRSKFLALPSRRDPLPSGPVCGTASGMAPYHRNTIIHTTDPVTASSIAASLGTLFFCRNRCHASRA
jgi:hypothetical protein